VDNASGVAAAVANHRVWFERLAAACGGAVERIGDVELAVVGGAAAMPFPGSAGLAAAVERCRALGLREVGCWAATPDEQLGVLLRALGFQDGWQPHWMALDPRAVDAAPAIEVERGRGEGSPRLPYWSPRRAMLVEAFPDDVVQLVVRDGDVLGEATVNVAGGAAGIFDMGVVPEARRRGFGLALTLAACRLARERGAEIVTLNATGEGEPVYRRAGFRSVGWGMTWWLFSG
jgi:ribosomal protein S18 acetylase RimI-like enzyme